MRWIPYKQHTDFTISVRYLNPDGSVKSVNKTITEKSVNEGDEKDTKYAMRWSIFNDQDLPDMDTAGAIATTIAKIYGASAVPTSMAFGGKDFMKDIP